MPNVDQCVRYAEEALCNNDVSYSQKIHQLDDSFKVLVFRNKDVKEISEIIKNCSITIKKCINQKFYNGNKKIEEIYLHKSSSNNKIGADLFHVLPDGKKINIEVKFGFPTDRNIGMKNFKKIFSCNAFSQALSVSKRRELEKLYKEEQDKNKHIRRLNTYINQAVDTFNKKMGEKNKTLTQQEQNFMEDFIIDNVGGNNISNEVMLKFLLYGNTFKNFKQLPTNNGTWEILPVQPLSDSVKRINIFVRNSTTNIQIKFTLNWKNDYCIKGLGKVPAKLGFGAPNWNVWVSVEDSTAEP